MKEIKFRAYIRSLKWVIPVERINFDIGTVEVDLTDGNGDTAEYGFDEIDLMQYTGLKDRNGVEIYEGDILQTDRYPGENYYIEIAVDEDPPHSFIYGWRKKPNAPVRGISDGIFTILGSERNFKDSEVIGNITDNPELIKGESK